MKYKIIFSVIFLSLSVFVSCAKYNITEQYFFDELRSTPKENLMTVILEEKIFQKYRNNIEVFKGKNETNENLQIKHIVPQFPTMILEPGDYTFFIISKNQYLRYSNSGKIIVKPYIYKIYLVGEAGKTYNFFQKDKGPEASFEFRAVKN